MRCNHRVAGRRPVAAIGAAGLMAGMMLAGGISEAFASTPLASAGVTNSRPPTPQEIVPVMLTSVDIPTQQPPPTGPKMAVRGDPDDGGQAR
jgi:hypothetical protein